MTDNKILKLLADIFRKPEHAKPSLEYGDFVFFAQFIKPIWKYAALSFFLIVFSAALSASIPLGCKILVDTFVLKKTMDVSSAFQSAGIPGLIPIVRRILGSAAVLSGLIMALGILAEAIKALQSAMLTRFYQEWAFNIQTALLKRAWRLPLFYLKKKTGGYLVSRIFNDIRTMYMGLIESYMLDSLAGIFFLVLSGGIVFYLSPRLALALFLAAPLWWFVTNFFAPRARARLLDAMEKEARVTKDAHEIFSGIETVKAYHSEKREAEKISETLRLFFNAHLRVALINIISNHLKKILKLVIALFLVLLGVNEIHHGRMTPGDLTAFMVYLAYFAALTNTLSNAYMAFQHVLASMERVREIFRILPEDNEKTARLMIPETIRGDIRFDHVRFGYEEGKTVLEDVSFTAPPGEIALLTGQSGAGKTTIINLLLKFISPGKGKIFIDGYDLNLIDTRWIRSKIGFVSQDIFLFDDTIENNIRYGNPAAGMDEVAKAAERAGIRREIESLPGGYGAIVGERGLNLSTGQRQRISIARALLKDPRMLIFDEPASALDSAAESVLKDSLKKAAKNRALFIIAHRMSFADISDKILKLEKGKIIEIQ